MTGVKSDLWGSLYGVVCMVRATSGVACLKSDLWGSLFGVACLRKGEAYGKGKVV